MADYTRITVALSQDEFMALRGRAEGDYRHPREQARYMLRQALGLPTAPPVQPQPAGHAQLISVKGGGGYAQTTQ